MKAAVGIDIGGTNIKMALVSPKGKLLKTSQLPVKSCLTETRLFSELRNTLSTLTDGLSGLELTGIGIGSPGANIKEGVIEKASNLPWEKLPVVEFLNQTFDVPTYLINDANLFAVGEKVFGAARHLNDFVVITLGTGVGAGIYSNGSLQQGRDGLAGEFGHVIIKPNGRACHCGRNGCLERYTSASGLVLSCRKILDKNPHIPSTLKKLPKQQLTAIQIMNAACAGDTVALNAFRNTGKILGRALADLAAYLNPEVIFLAGGLSKAGHYLFEPTIKSFNKNLLNIYPKAIPVKSGSIPDDQAGVLGAAALVWEAQGQLERINPSVI